MFNNEYKTVFHPEKGVKGMIKETFVTLESYSQQCFNNSTLQMNLLFSLWDNNSLRQERDVILSENQELLVDYIRSICEQINQNYSDYVKYRIPESKIRICKQIISLIHLCEKKQKSFNEIILQQLKSVFEVCYAIIKDLQCRDTFCSNNIKKCEDRLLTFFNIYEDTYLFQKEVILNIKNGVYKEQIAKLINNTNS